MPLQKVCNKNLKYFESLRLQTKLQRQRGFFLRMNYSEVYEATRKYSTTVSKNKEELENLMAAWIKQNPSLLCGFQRLPSSSCPAKKSANYANRIDIRNEVGVPQADPVFRKPIV